VYEREKQQDSDDSKATLRFESQKLKQWQADNEKQIYIRNDRVVETARTVMINSFLLYMQNAKSFRSSYGCLHPLPNKWCAENDKKCNKK